MGNADNKTPVQCRPRRPAPDVRQHDPRRTARLPLLKAMVRIDAEGPPWKVTMCPPDKIPNGGKGRFLVWREAADNPLAYSRAVNAEANPRNVVVFSIDEQGEKV